MTDHLKKLSVDELAAWYLRLADFWSKIAPGVKQPLVGEFLRTWVNNRQVDAEYYFDAPEHLRSLPAVLNEQRYHREVFLTNVRARFTGGKQKWAGVLPRIQGLPGFQKWDMKSDLPLEYESLCDPAPNLIELIRVQKYGTPAERDITGSLRGFQLKSRCVLSAVSGPPNQQGATLLFKSWVASATDRYDWNEQEHLTVPNPDHGSKESYAVQPEEKTITVYHSNAIRLEKAGKAAPFKVVIKPWNVMDAGITGPGQIADVQRKLP